MLSEFFFDFNGAHHWGDKNINFQWTYCENLSFIPFSKGWRNYHKSTVGTCSCKMVGFPSNSTDRNASWMAGESRVLEPANYLLSITGKKTSAIFSRLNAQQYSDTCFLIFPGQRWDLWSVNPITTETFELPCDWFTRPWTIKPSTTRNGLQ